MHLFTLVYKEILSTRILNYIQNLYIQGFLTYDVDPFLHRSVSQSILNKLLQMPCTVKYYTVL